MEYVYKIIKDNSIYFVIALSFVLCAFYFYNRRKVLNIRISGIFVIDILHTIIFLISCKFLSYIEYGIVNSFTKSPTISIENGYSFFGNIYIMPIFYIIYALITKRDVKKVLDIATPAILMSAFCARLNCMLSGCCKGINMFNTGFLFPTREIELICYLLILQIIITKTNHKTLKAGTAFPIYLIIYGIVRMIEEPFRANFTKNNIHFAFIHCTIAIMVGSILYIIFSKQKTKHPVINENEL